MARHDQDLAENRAKCKRLQKQLNDSLAIYPKMLLKEAQEVLPAIITTTVDNARFELLECNGIYIDLCDFNQHNEFPCILNEKDRYTESLLLLAALVIPDLDPFHLIYLDKSFSEKSLTQHRIESNYADLLFPLHILGVIEQYLLTDRECSRLMRDLLDMAKGVYIPQVEIDSVNVEICELKVRLASLLQVISELMNMCDPVTGDYYVVMKRQREELSQKRKIAASKRTKVSYDAKLYLDTFYSKVYTHMMKVDVNFNRQSTLNACVNFTQGISHSSMSKILITTLNKLLYNFKIANNQSSNDESIFRFVFNQISKEYH